LKKQLLKKFCFAIVLVQILILVWSKTASADAPHELDITFNNTGVVTSTAAIGYALNIRPNGKIMVGGSVQDNAALAQYNTDGKLDTSFNNTGVITIPIAGSVTSIATQPDNNKIISVVIHDTGSAFEYFLIRHTVTGTLDTSFNATGIVKLPVNSHLEAAADILIQPDNKIVVACKKVIPQDVTIIARYNTDGNLDTSFNGTGIITNTIGLISHSGPSLALNSSGKIVVVGSGSGYGFVAQYNSNGSLDTDFNGTGVVTKTAHAGTSLAIQADGKIISAGGTLGSITPDFSVVRYNSDGSLDTSFNSTGMATVDIGGGWDLGSSVAIQSNGKIVVGGNSWNSSTNSYDFAVVRFDEQGKLDQSWNGTGFVTTPVNGDVSFPRLAIQFDGKILIAGNQSTPSNGEVGLMMVRSVGDSSFAVLYYLPIILK
jgi:uncharacterized delta-60 repeat protein